MKPLVLIILCLSFLLPGEVRAQKEFNVYLGNGYFADTESRSDNLKEGTYRFGEIRYLPLRLNRLKMGIFLNGTQSAYTFSGYVGDGYSLSGGPSFSYERRIWIFRSYSWLNAGTMITNDGGHQGKYRQNLDYQSWYASGGIALADTGMFNKKHVWFHQHKLMFSLNQPFEAKLTEMVTGISENERGDKNLSYVFTYQTNVTSWQKLGLRFDPVVKFSLGREGYSSQPDFYQAGIGLEILRIYNQPLLAISYQRKFLADSRQLNVITIEMNATETYRFFAKRHKQKKLSATMEKKRYDFKTNENVEQ